MHFKLESSRHTAVGTFQAHVIYTVDDKDARAMQCIMPLVKGKKAAGKILTAAEVEKDLKSIKSLIPETVKDDLPDIKKPRQVMAALKKSRKAATALEGDLLKANDANADLVEERDNALELAEKSETACSEAVAELAAMTAKLEAVQAELDGMRAEKEETEATSTEAE